MKFRVIYNLHRYGDLSDSPHKGSRTVEIPDDTDPEIAQDVARETLRALEKIGKSYIGYVFDAEPVEQEAK